MKTSLLAAIVVFVISLASFDSGAVPIFLAAASVGWILFVLWRTDRATTIDEAQYEQEIAMRENRKKAPRLEPRYLDNGNAK